MSRRRFVLLATTGIAAIVSLAGWMRWQSVGTLRHRSNPGTVSDIDSNTAETIVSFLGTLFGVELTPEDVADLTERLDFAVRHDDGWREEYDWLARHLDTLARDVGNDSFLAAIQERRYEIMLAAVAAGEDGRAQRIRAFFHPEGRALLRMRRSTLPHLHYLYRNSGVPWRQRGYVSWPGRPDDRLAYTRPLDSFRC